MTFHNDSNVPILLYVDTTGKTLYLAVSKGEEMLTHRAIDSTSYRYHSAILVPELRALLNEVNLSPNDLSGVVVNIGPGSFTGIRTGLTTVRTIGQWCPQVLMLPLTQFQIWAMASKQIGLAFPAAYYGDGLRGRAYYSVMNWENAQPKELTLPSLITPSEATTEQVPVATVFMAEGLMPYWKASLQEQALTPLSDLSQDMPKVVHQALIDLDASLNRHHPWVKPWEEVLPLYVQRPNITMPKKKQNLASSC